MRRLLISVVMIVSLQLVAQTDYYSKKGVVIGGYDVTSYFDNAPVKGMKEYASSYEGATFYFASKGNKQKFEVNPKKFIPQYGGYCAYAIGLKNEKVKIDPETYEIRDGKLYMFYNSWGVNTLNLWNKEGAEKLKARADENWKNIGEK